MITGYCADGTAVVLTPADPPESLRSDLIWLDLVEPNKAEDLMMEKLLGISIPTSRTSSLRAVSISRRTPCS